MHVPKLSFCFGRFRFRAPCLPGAGRTSFYSHKQNLKSTKINIIELYLRQISKLPIAESIIQKQLTTYRENVVTCQMPTLN
ncbi:unnamed protein product [Rhizophagus irregularis]|nr:unnamed protein product [Rhizophagus irregularis]